MLHMNGSADNVLATNSEQRGSETREIIIVAQYIFHTLLMPSVIFEILFYSVNCAHVMCQFNNYIYASLWFFFFFFSPRAIAFNKCKCALPIYLHIPFHSRLIPNFTAH